jgi:dihydroorotate dehydrogenase
MIDYLRFRTIRFLYKKVARPVFFLFDPEFMHKVFIGVGQVLGTNFISGGLTRLLFSYNHKSLEQEVLGFNFKNPIGLAAGFDKDGEMTLIMEEVGFGFLEIGSVTAQASQGNRGLRLKRIVEKNSLWVNLGLNNKGVLDIKKRLSGKKRKILWGISVARTNSEVCADEDVAIKDYLFSFKNMKGVGDFFVVNISCPNSYGGQPFSNAKRYEKLIKSIKDLKLKEKVLVKLSPDLNKREIDKIMNISKKYNVSGYICSNLTKKKGKIGGYSGKIVEKKANEMIKYVYGKKDRDSIIIGCGGILCAKDAYKKIKLGANLVELVTGMIYEGPGIVGEINYGLSKIIAKEGYSSIKEAVGVDVNN